MNEWKISGEIIYLKELMGEFAASLKIRSSSQGTTKGRNNQILELPCLMTKTVFRDSIKKGLKKFSKCCISGHMESWYKSDKIKVFFIADLFELK